MDPDDWEALYGQEWIPPDDPGPPPILEARTSVVNVKNQIYVHHNNVAQYTWMGNTYSALKQDIVATFDVYYLVGLRDFETRFS